MTTELWKDEPDIGAVIGYGMLDTLVYKLVNIRLTTRWYEVIVDPIPKVKVEVCMQVGWFFLYLCDGECDGM